MRIAKKAGWGHAPSGRHQGIALMSGYDTYLAQVAEVSVEGNKLKVHKIVCAIDCGQMVNPTIVHQQAEVWARRLLSEMHDASTDERIRHLFLAAFSRPPSEIEVGKCRATLREVNGSSEQERGTVEAWTEVCHALFGVKEFMYVR